MPCDDVTETLELRLDGADRLAGYRLRKRSCGRAVGEESLLAPAFAGMRAEELLAMDAEAFADAHPFHDEVDAFLKLKHFFAVQAGLRVLLGIDSGLPDDPCTLAAVVCEAGDTILEADLSVNILTERIKACGNCRGCGALKKMFATA